MYLNAVDSSQREAYAVRARASAPQPGGTGKPLQKLQPSALLQTPRENETMSASSFTSGRIFTKSLDSVNLYHPERTTVQFESSTGAATSDATDRKFALAENTVSARRLPTRLTRHGTLGQNG